MLNAIEQRRTENDMSSAKDKKRDANGDASSAGAAPITIKKYANRRLYNTATSSYVTLDTLSGMVKEGHEFLVFDAKSGDDITRSVLTQIIFEEEAKGENLLPIKFLRQLIGFYGNSMQGFVPDYLEMSLESLTKNQAEFTRAFGGDAAVEAMQTMTAKNTEMFRNAMQMFTPFGAMPGAGLGTEAAKPAREPEKPADIEALREQISQLQSAIDSMAKKES